MVANKYINPYIKYKTVIDYLDIDQNYVLNIWQKCPEHFKHNATGSNALF